MRNKFDTCLLPPDAFSPFFLTEPVMAGYVLSSGVIPFSYGLNPFPDYCDGAYPPSKESPFCFFLDDRHGVSIISSEVEIGMCSVAFFLGTLKGTRYGDLLHLPAFFPLLHLLIMRDKFLPTSFSNEGGMF